MTLEIPAIITLTTDFGLQDGYVAAMKAVILGLNPKARLVDISHQIPPQDIQAAALVLRDTCPHFPANTIHLVVVDPGVGTARRGLAVETERALFVLPDNGLLSFYREQDPIRHIYELKNQTYFRKEISNTFHGRDIFAPCAAHLSLGLPASHLGPEIRSLVEISFEPAKISKTHISGTIIQKDVYGNLITNISVGNLGNTSWRLTCGHTTLTGPQQTYGSVATGQALFLFGSSGYLEIAINGGSAEKVLNCQVGDKVELERQ